VVQFNSFNSINISYSQILPQKGEYFFLILVYLKKELIIYHSNMYLSSSPNQSLVKKFYKAIIYCIFHIIRSGFFLDIFLRDRYMMSWINILIVAKLAVALSIEVHVQNYTKLQKHSQGLVLYNICLILLDILYCTS
jgi:hypothetical protein